RDRRAMGPNGLLQAAGIGPGPPQLQDRVAGGDAVLNGRAVVEPDVRKPRAGPGGRRVFAEQVLGPARNVADDRGIDIAVAELGADHLIRLALFDIGDLGKRVARALAVRGVVADVRIPHVAPFAPADGRVARCTDIAIADLAPLAFVG